MRRSAISTWVVVPTYWGPSHVPIYDHPTPLSGTSTLPALLESLSNQVGAGEFGVLILVASVSVEWEAVAWTRVQSLVAPFAERLHLRVADARAAHGLEQRVWAAGYKYQLAGMRGYGAVRNMQLLIPAILGAELVIALDDDEVVDGDYVRRAAELVGTARQGDDIVGVAGLYADETGEILLEENDSVENLILHKSIFMNQAYRRFLAGDDRLKRTPLALGGNMVFSRALFAEVGFDPSITRGEDIDYVINAQLKGVSFFMDRELVVTHLPPRHYETPAYCRMRQDVMRFLYEREKLRIGGLDASAFDPYPGELLGDDLEEHARAGLDATVTEPLAALLGDPASIMEEALAAAKQLAPRYFEFAERWPRLMDVVSNDPELQKQIAAAGSSSSVHASG